MVLLPSAQQCFDGVGAVQHAFGIVRLRRVEHAFVRFLAVDAQLGIPQAGHVEARPAQGFLELEVAPEIHGLPRPGAGKANPIGVPVLRRQQPHFKIGGRAVRSHRVCAIPGPHAPPHALFAGERLPGIFDQIGGRRHLAAVPQVGLAARRPHACWPPAPGRPSAPARGRRPLRSTPAAAAGRRCPTDRPHTRSAAHSDLT